MYDIIKTHNQEGGKITDAKSFAESIGLTSQIFSKYNTHKQHVTLPIIVKACIKYRMNPTYIILGEGLPFLDEKYVDKVKELEDRLKRIEKMLK